MDTYTQYYLTQVQAKQPKKYSNLSDDKSYDICTDRYQDTSLFNKCYDAAKSTWWTNKAEGYAIYLEGGGTLTFKDWKKGNGAGNEPANGGGGTGGGGTGGGGFDLSMVTDTINNVLGLFGNKSPGGYTGGVPSHNIPPPKKDNTALIVGVIGGVVVIGLITYMVIKKKK